MKILDKYIIYNFLITFIFFTISLISISIIINISQSLSLLELNNGSIKEALIYYYPSWSLWLGNTFIPIGVFISVIFFTSRMSNNNEIIAIYSSGISNKRIMYPYFITSSIIFLISLLLNHFVLPITNIIKNNFYYNYIIHPETKYNIESNKKINIYLGHGKYLFIDSFSKSLQEGVGFMYIRFINNKLNYILFSDKIKWNKIEMMYNLFNYKEYNINIYKNDIIKIGKKIKIKIPFISKNFLLEKYRAENMNSIKLYKFIKNKIKKNINNINSNILLNEYYQRTSIPFSTFILTLLAFFFSSKKYENNICNNLVLGTILAFSYIFFIELSKSFSSKNYISSFLAVWIPNIIFSIIIFFLKKL